MFFGTVSGGLSAELTGGNFWQGAAIGLTVSALNHVMHKITESKIEYSDKFLRKFAKRHFGNVKGFDKNRYTISSPENASLDSDGSFLFSDGSEAYGYTDQNTNISHISKAAFSSYSALWHVVGHETLHQYYNIFAPVSVIIAEEAAAWKWNFDALKNVPVQEKWLNDLIQNSQDIFKNYHRSDWNYEHSNIKLSY